MADISEILESLGGSKQISEITAQLEQLERTKARLKASGDIGSFTQVVKLQKATRQLIKIQEEQLHLQEELKEVKEDDAEAQERLISAIKKNQEAHRRAKGVIVSAMQEQQKAVKQAERAVVEYNERAIEAFDRSRTGRVFNAMTGSVAKFTGAITVAGLAMKAFSRYAEASNVRTEIMIRSFQGLEYSTADADSAMKDLQDTSKGAFSTLVSAVPTMVKTFGKAAPETLTFHDALLKTRLTAIRMGVDVNEANRAMIEFSRIAGTRNPEALATLSSGAIAVSRAMNLDVAEAIDFVALRMEKFGGTSASAISALDDMRRETEKINKAFGRTVVKGDDIVKTLLNISRQSNVYAIDQRLVGSLLRDNIARLQSTGESYDMALRKAQAYVDAVTGQDNVPEWMKILSGGDIFKEMIKVYDSAGKDGPQAFLKQFGAQLDAAKPGLSKKVLEILEKTKTGELGQYSAIRLIQELTAVTDVGVSAMDKQILKLTKYGENVELIAKQLGVSREVAASMIQQAKERAKSQEELTRLSGLNAEMLAKELGISVKMAQRIKGNAGDIKKTMKYNEAVLRVQQDQQRTVKEIKEAEGARQAAILKSKQLSQEINELESEGPEKNAKLIAMLQAQRKEVMEEARQVETRAIQNRLGFLNARIQESTDALKSSDLSEKERTRLVEERKKNVEELEDLKKRSETRELDVAKKTETLKEAFLRSSVETGGYLKEISEKMSNITTVVGVLGSLVLIKGILFVTNRNVAGIKQMLKIAMARGMYGGQQRPGAAGGAAAGAGGGAGPRGGAGGAAAVPPGVDPDTRQRRMDRAADLRSRRDRGQRLRGGLKKAGKWGALIAGGAALLGMASSAFASDKPEEPGKDVDPDKEADKLEGATEEFKAKYEKAAAEGGFVTTDTATGLAMSAATTVMPGLVGKMTGALRGTEPAAAAAGGGAAPRAPTPAGGAPGAPAPTGGAAPKKGFFGRMFGGIKDFASGAAEKVGGLAGKASSALGGVGGKALKMAKGAGKYLVKGGPVGLALSALQLSDVIPDLMEGEWKKAALKAIPTVTGAVGGTLGAMGGGALGTLVAPGVGTAVGGIAGGAAGGAAGTALGEWIVGLIDDKDKMKDKMEKSDKAMTKIAATATAIKATQETVAQSAKEMKQPKVVNFSRDAVETLRSVNQPTQAAVGAPPPTPDAPSADRVSLGRGDVEANLEGPFPDGSVTFKVNGFLDAYAKASAKTRQGPRSRI